MMMVVAIELYVRHDLTICESKLNLKSLIRGCSLLQLIKVLVLINYIIGLKPFWNKTS